MSHTFEPTRAPGERSRAPREPDAGDPGGPAPGGPDAARREAGHGPATGGLPDRTPARSARSFEQVRAVAEQSRRLPAADAEQLGMTTTFPAGRPQPSPAAHRLATQAVELAAVREAHEAQQAVRLTPEEATQHATRAADGIPPAEPIGTGAQGPGADRGGRPATGVPPLGGPAAGPAVPQGTAYLTSPQPAANRPGSPVGGPAASPVGEPVGGPVTGAPGSRPPAAAAAPAVAAGPPSLPSAAASVPAPQAVPSSEQGPAVAPPELLAASAAVLDLAQAAIDLEPAMALAGGGFAGAERPGAWGEPPATSRPDAPEPESRRSRRDVVNAAAQPPENRDERAARRGRGGMSGPAAGRALGSKIVPDGPPRGDRGARPAGGRRYLPLPEAPEEVRPEAAEGDRMPTVEPMHATGQMRVPGMPTTEPMHGAPIVQPPVMPPGTGSVPWLQQDEPSFTAAFAPGYDGYGNPTGERPVLQDDPLGDTGTRLLRAVEDEPALDGPAPSLVRPYSRTGGRTKPGRELDLEALVATTVNGKEAWSSPLLNPEHVQVIGLCMDTTSVAEVAARLSVPIGVARVIIADMVDLGLVEVGKTSANYGDERDPAFLRRVLSGLQRL